MKRSTVSPTAIEGRRGYARVVSAQQNWEQALVGLGEHFEITSNTFKPYACGLVIHPCWVFRSNVTGDSGPS